MRSIALLCFLVIAPLVTQAADWGKVSWGMSRSEVTTQYPSAVAAGDSLAVTKAGEILGIPFDATFDFQEDKLVAIALKSDNTSPLLTQSNANSFRDLLIGKYGAPLFYLNTGPTLLQGVWRSDRSVIKFSAPPAGTANQPAYSLFYRACTSSVYDEI